MMFQHIFFIVEVMMDFVKFGIEEFYQTIQINLWVCLLDIQMELLLFHQGYDCHQVLMISKG